VSTPETPRDLMAALQASLARTWTLEAASFSGDAFDRVGRARTFSGPALRKGEHVEVVEKAVVDAERERLRRRTHEIAEAKDAEHAAVKRELGKLRSAVDQARERTKDWKADWTDDPRSQGPYGWWRYTSHNRAMEAVALVAERERLLDLLADARRQLGPMKRNVSDGTRLQIDDALREYGRLGKEGS
jgi:hypothetical protein